MLLESIKEDLKKFNGLQGVFITTLPDCLLFDSYLLQKKEWDLESVASYFGDLSRANKEALKTLEQWSSDVQITIETPEMRVILKELPNNYVVGFIIDTNIPLGMVRLNTDRILKLLQANIQGKEAAEELPRIVRVIQYLQRYSPDPHVALTRLSLRTGIPYEKIKNPEQLNTDEVQRVEHAIKQILGVASLNI